MDDIKDLIGRFVRRGEDQNKTASADLNRKINALYSIYANLVGPEELIVRMSRYDAPRYIHDEDPRLRLVGLQRLILESRDFHHPPADEEIPFILDNLEEKLSDLLARRAVEEQLERKITARLEERHQEYVDEIRQEILDEEMEDIETPQSRAKMEKLEALDKVSLTDTAMKVLRPQKMSEIIGQDRAVEAMLSKLGSPYPQHMILYGPPGVGKTTAARLVLEAVAGKGCSAFKKDAPFVECDGTTLRWDNRDITNPLIGSVHDPIYQGAQRDLADDGIPEPKPGLVTDAHGGVLFIDEIGELDPIMLNKLLKVLEDKRVHFESAYYNEDDPWIPAYIHKLFKDGAPADFILIGATTRLPEEINPAIRSRCAEIFFDPLSPESVAAIAKDAAARLGVPMEDGAAELISEYTMEGRKAVNLLSDAYGRAVYRAGTTAGAAITRDLIRETARAARMSPWREKLASPVPRVGHVYGLGVSGYWGSIIEIEAAAYPAAGKGKGSIRFNETAGSMAKDSVATAASVVRMLLGKDLSDYDLHINVIGGGNIDGPSAGCAITSAILSAVEKVPLRQDVALTGEISLTGEVKPVGGVPEKAFGACQAGMKTLLIPEKNKDDIPPDAFGLRVIPVKTIEEVRAYCMVPKGETAHAGE